MLILQFFLIPILVLSAAIYFWFKKKRYGLGSAFLMFFINAGILSWAILQSSGSTAAVGLVFVPGIASVCGFLVWLFMQLRLKTRFELKVLGYLCLGASLAMCGYGVERGLSERQKKKERLELSQKTQDYFIWINQNIKSLSGKEAAWLKSEVLSKISDEAFLRAALMTKFISPETIELISSSENANVLGLVISHQNTDEKLLVKIFEKRKDDNRYDYSFAMNHNTPTPILEFVYKRSPFAASIMAKNTNVSKDLLLEISKSKDLMAAEAVVTNPKTDCDVLKSLHQTLSGSFIKELETQRIEIFNEVTAKIKDLCPVQ